MDGIARLFLASLYHELDNVHIDGGSEDGIQLLLGRLAQVALVTLVGEKYLESYETKSSNG